MSSETAAMGAERICDISVIGADVRSFAHVRGPPGKRFPGGLLVCASYCGLRKYLPYLHAVNSAQLRLRIRKEGQRAVIEKFRVIANDRATALTSAAKTLKNDPAVQDWWLCVSAYLIS